MLIVTRNPEHYLSTTDWIKESGSYLLTFIEPTATGGEFERRVLFDGMLNVDFSIIPDTKFQHLSAGIPSETEAALANIGRAMLVLLDKDGTMLKLKQHILQLKTTRRSPTQQEFLQVVSDFFYHAVLTAKHLRRSEIWRAEMTSNCYMQRLMLRMVEWHARTLRGWSYDTWFNGRFLEIWADPSVLEAMKTVFAHYDTKDIVDALFASMGLFRETGKEVASKLGLQFPEEADKNITNWVESSLRAICE